MKPQSHWGEQELTRWMFGLQEEDDHTRSCSQCQAELQRLQAMRHSVQAEGQVSPEFLAAQRRSIHSRLHQPAHTWMRMRIWAPVSAGVALAAIGVALMVPARTAQQPLLSDSDQKFFTEISSMEQSSEPRAIEPIRSMFEQ
jgi:ferric-dicitrate binding protein FerR (iron transport regulator)